MGHGKSNSWWKVHSDEGIPQKPRKISNNPTHQLKELEKGEQANRKSEETRLKTSG